MGGGASKSKATNYQEGADNNNANGNEGQKKKEVPRLKEGDTIPNVTIKARIRIAPGEDHQKSFAWKDVTMEQLFKGKRIVMFSIPGAFTPVCSCDHLPGYEDRYDEVLKMGVDDIYCISVNDAFVMRQWGKMQGLEEETGEDSKCALNPGNFKRVKLVPDGAAAFTRGMGMICHFNNVNGYGERSWRYSAVINDMKIEKLFVEEGGAIVDDPDKDNLLVSDSGTMLTYLEQTKPKN